MKSKIKRYCQICGKKLEEIEGSLYCSTMNKEHGFCCDDPDCQVDGKFGRISCSECNAKCNKCKIVFFD